MKDLLIKNAFVVDPKAGRNGEFDVSLHAGKIAKIGNSLPPGAAEILEGKGLHLFPGFIDLHTHFREPGYESKETISTGSRA